MSLKSIEEYETQIKNLITMIMNKERKKINKWKKDEDWYSDYGLCNDCDTFYHIFNFIEHLGGTNNFLNYVNFTTPHTFNSEVPFNSDVKWKSIKMKNEFFDTFTQ